MTQLTDNLFAVEVPEGADGYDFNIVNDHYELTYYTMEDEEKELHGIKIPDGNWRVLCTTREVKAMHAPALFGYAMLSDHYAQETIKALITSKGLDADKNILLLENYNPWDTN